MHKKEFKNIDLIEDGQKQKAYVVQLKEKQNL